MSENKEDVCKGIVYLGNDDVCISSDSFAFSHFQNPKFIGYTSQTDIFNKYKEQYAYGAKVTRLNIKALQDFKIPLPPLEIQNTIVEILDKLDSLINDLNQGIPA
ncbi:restriction endonuclease subunit S, partial [Helicobacter muridarum]